MKNMQKMWAIAASLVAVTSGVYADVDSAQMRNLENRVNALEQRKSAGGMINPPGRPQVRDGANLFLFGDLIVWNAHENGLPVAVVNKGSSLNLSHSRAVTVHSDWDAGFRVGVGYNLPHDGWDLSLSWLRFNTDGDKKIHAHSNTFVYPSRIAPSDPVGGFFSCAKASSRWRVHLNQLDLDLGREFFVSKWLTMRPHFGVRTDWIRQKWNTEYRNFPLSFFSPPNRVESEYKDQWWGIGLEGGLDTQWGLGAGWSLFGNLSTAIIYGFHTLKYEDEDSPATAATASNGDFVKLHNTYRVSHPVLDLVMGLRYDYMFYNDRFHVGLALGWENHIYFNQNQFPVFVDDVAKGVFVSNQGDLTYQGWTVAARFDF